MPRDAEAAVQGQPSLRLRTAIRRLVQTIDCDRVVRGGTLEPAPPVRRIVTVGVAAGIHDQRSSARGDLDVERVVVPVAAVAERSAIENEKPLVLECDGTAPSAALNVVAAVREADVGKRRTVTPCAARAA
jgi:hypothetical protein